MAKPNKENLNVLHKALSDKYELGTEDEFAYYMQDEDNQRKLYEKIAPDYEVGESFEDFQYGLSADATTGATDVAPEVDPDVSDAVSGATSSANAEEERTIELKNTAKNIAGKVYDAVKTVMPAPIGTAIAAYDVAAKVKESFEETPEEKAAREKYIRGAETKGETDKYIAGKIDRISEVAKKQGASMDDLMIQREDLSAEQYLDDTDKPLYSVVSDINKLESLRRKIISSGGSIDAKGTSVSEINKQIKDLQVKYNDTWKRRTDGIDEEIAGIDVQLAAMQAPGAPVLPEALANRLKARKEFLENRRETFFLTPEDVISKVEKEFGDTDSDSSLSASERVDLMYHSMLQEIYDIAEDNTLVKDLLRAGDGVPGEDIGTFLDSFVESLPLMDNPEFDRARRLAEMVEFMAPVVLTNTSPTNTAANDNMLNTYAKSFVNAFTDDGTTDTNLENSQRVFESFIVNDIASSVRDLDYLEKINKFDPNKGFDHYGLGDMEYWSGMMGTTTALGVQLFATRAGVGAAKKLSMGTKLYDVMKYVDSPVKMSRALSNSKYFRTLRGTSLGKKIFSLDNIKRGVDMMNEGALYSTAGTLFASQDDELNFLAGTFGSLGKGTLKLAGKVGGELWQKMNFGKNVVGGIFGERADEAMGVLMKAGNVIQKTAGAGMGEVAEETMQQLAGIMRTDNKGVFDAIQSLTGDSKALAELAISSFVMGAGFGAGSYLGTAGHQTMIKSLEKLRKSDPAAYNIVVNQLKRYNQDLKFSIDSSVKDPGKAEYIVDGQSVDKEFMDQLIQESSSVEDISGVVINGDKEMGDMLVSRGLALSESIYDKETGEARPVTPEEKAKREADYENKYGQTEESTEGEPTEVSTPEQVPEENTGEAAGEPVGEVAEKTGEQKETKTPAKEFSSEEKAVMASTESSEESQALFDENFEKLDAATTADEESRLTKTLSQESTPESIEKELRLAKESRFKNVEKSQGEAHLMQMYNEAAQSGETLFTAEEIEEAKQRDERGEKAGKLDAFWNPTENKLYIHPLASKGSVLHEQGGHAVADMLRDTNPELYESFKASILTDPVFKPIKEYVKKGYPELFEGGEDLDGIFHEMWSFLVQGEGINSLEKLDAKQKKGILAKFKDYVYKALQSLGLLPKGVDYSDVDITWETIQDPAKLAKTTAEALTSGKEVRFNVSKEEAVPANVEGISAADTEDLNTISEAAKTHNLGFKEGTPAYNALQKAAVIADRMLADKDISLNMPTYRGMMQAIHREYDVELLGNDAAVAALELMDNALRATENKLEFVETKETQKNTAAAEAVGEASKESAPEQKVRASKKKQGKKKKPTGEDYQNFFAQVAKGLRDVGKGKYVPGYDLSQHEGADKFLGSYPQHQGKFDKHIAMSIPGYFETQAVNGSAVIALEKPGAAVIDIGGSDASWAKTISSATDGGVSTTVVDPNTAMNEEQSKRSDAPNFEYIEEAFMEGWTEDDGTVIPAWDPDKTYDVVHEGMTFQFIDSERDSRIAYIKDNVIKPDGIFISEEKFLASDEGDWDAAEAVKDAYKEKYFSKKELAKKKKEVLEGKEDEIEGMTKRMVKSSDYEKTLGKYFTHVAQYWDSGNFRGYIASDSKEKFNAYKEHMKGLPHAIAVATKVLGKDSKKLESARKTALEHTAGKTIANLKNRLDTGLSLDGDLRGFDDNKFFNTHGEHPVIVTLTNTNVSANDLSVDKIMDFINKYPDAFLEKDVVIGLYPYDKGNGVSIDLNLAVPESKLEAAKKFAEFNNQESIFLYKNQDYVYTNGDGDPVLTDEGDVINAITSLRDGEGYTPPKKLRKAQRPDVEIAGDRSLLNVKNIRSVAAHGIFTGDIKGLDKNTRSKKEIYKFFDRFIRETGYARYSQEDLKNEKKAKNIFARAVATAVEEVDFQLMHKADSGMDWYTEQFLSTMSRLEQADSRFASEENKGFFSILLAMMSVGQNPRENFHYAYSAFNHWDNHGVIPEVDFSRAFVSPLNDKMVELEGIVETDTEISGTNIKTNKQITIKKSDLKPDGINYKKWGTIPAAAVIKNIMAAYDHNGRDMAKMLEWWKNKHPAEELLALNPRVKNNDGVKPKKGEMLYGGYVLGDKIGPYSLSLMQIPDVLTIDVWLNRTWGRWLGDMFVKKRSPKDAPTTIDRMFLNQVIGSVADIFDMTIGETQAVLWYYEQNLWTAAGYKSPSLSYEDGLQKVIKKYGLQPSEHVEDSAETRKRRAAARSSAFNRLYVQGVGSLTFRTRGTKPENPIRLEDIKAESLSFNKEIRKSKNISNKIGEAINDPRTVVSQTWERVVNDTSGKYTDLQATVSQSRDAYLHEVQNIGELTDRINVMSLDEALVNFTRGLTYTLNDKEARNDTVLLGIKAVDKALERGDGALASAIFEDLTAVGTTVGQMLRQFAELKTLSPYTPVKLLDDELRKHGLGLDDAQIRYFTSLSKQILNAKNAMDSFRSEFMNNPSQEAADLYNQAAGAQQKAYNQMAHDVNMLVPKGMTTLLQQMMQGNALTPMSLIVNVTANMGHSLLRLGERFVGDTTRSFVDFIRTGRWHNTMLPALYHGTGQMITTIPDAVKKMFTADDRFGDMDKFDIKGGYIDSFNMLKDQLYKTFAPESKSAEKARLRTPKSNIVTITTKAGDKYKGVISGRFSNGIVLTTSKGKDLKFNNGDIDKKDYHLPVKIKAERMFETWFPNALVADAMFRGLVVGDYSPRKAAETAEAARIYFGDPELKKGGQLGFKMFIKSPSTEFNKRIKAAGDEAVFTSQRFLPSVVSYIDSALDKKLEEHLGSEKFVAQAVKSVASLLKRAVLLFKGVPANYIQTALELTIPPISLTEAMVKYEGGDKRGGDYMLGRAFMGSTLYVLGYQMVKNGLLSVVGPSDDEEERDVHLKYSPSRGVNRSALIRYFAGEEDWNKAREGDKWDDFSNLGEIGFFLAFYADYAKRLKKAGRESSTMVSNIPVINPEDAMVGFLSVIDAGLNKEFLQGAQKLQLALGRQDPGYLMDILKPFGYLAVPNVVRSFGKAQRKHYFAPSQKSFVSKMNSEYHRAMSNEFTEEDAPLINVWGQMVKVTPDEYNPYVYQLFNVFKTKELDDMVNYQVAQLWNKVTDKTTGTLISPPSRRAVVKGYKLPDGTVRSAEVKLDPLDYAQVAAYAGALKRSSIEKLMESKTWSGLDDFEKWNLIHSVSLKANSEAGKFARAMLQGKYQSGAIDINKDEKSYEYTDSRQFMFDEATKKRVKGRLPKMVDIEELYKNDVANQR